MMTDRFEKKALDLAKNGKPVHDLAFDLLFDLALKEIAEAEKAKAEAKKA